VKSTVTRCGSKAFVGAARQPPAPEMLCGDAD
jgi:hypothetical protein